MVANKQYFGGRIELISQCTSPYNRITGSLIPQCKEPVRTKCFVDEQVIPLHFSFRRPSLPLPRDKVGTYKWRIIRCPVCICICQITSPFNFLALTCDDFKTFWLIFEKNGWLLRLVRYPQYYTSINWALQLRWPLSSMHITQLQSRSQSILEQYGDKGWVPHKYDIRFGYE